MIANDNRPDSAPPENRLTPTILTAALAIGIVAYVVMAWALQSFGAGQPSVLGENRRVAVYAVLAFLGLGSAALSFILRKLMLSRPGAAQGQRRLVALVVGLALAETPALLGLIYFVFSYDWPGFLLLVAASLICFILHARRG